MNVSYKAIIAEYVTWLETLGFSDGMDTITSFACMIFLNGLKADRYKA